MKSALRKEVLQNRKLLSQEEQLTKSENIFQSLKALSLYKNAESVFLYIDFRSEVRTNPIMKDLLGRGKMAVVPMSISGTRDMILSEVLDPENELSRSSYGILEPKPEYIREIDPNSIDLVIVPGVAFDPRGYRIGYGGGYYDMFFSKLKKPIPSIALAYELQIIESVPEADYDYPVDYIITESRIIHCRDNR